METYRYLVLNSSTTNLGELEFNARLIKGDYINVEGIYYEVVAVVIRDVQEHGQSDIDGESIRHNGGDLYVREINLQNTILTSLIKS